MKQYIRKYLDPTTLGMAAATAGNNVLGAGMGLLLEGHNDRRQIKQQQRLLDQQYGIDNKMAEENYKRQMRMWEETNYSAQMDQLTKAGLNPALMYKQGGPGGTTAAATGAVSSAKAPAGGMEIMNMMMQQAQIELLKAQTEKTKAEVPNVALQGKNIEASTGSLLQGIENAKAQKELTEIQTGIASIEEHIKGMTQNQAVAMAMSELRSATATMHMLERNNDIDAATKQEKINIIKTELATMLIDNELTNQQITASKEQIAGMWTELSQKWTSLSQTERQTLVTEKLAGFTTGSKFQLEKVQTILKLAESLMSKLNPGASAVLNAIKPTL